MIGSILWKFHEIYIHYPLIYRFDPLIDKKIHCIVKSDIFYNYIGSPQPMCQILLYISYYFFSN